MCPKYRYAYFKQDSHREVLLYVKGDNITLELVGENLTLDCRRESRQGRAAKIENFAGQGRIGILKFSYGRLQGAKIPCYAAFYI